MIKILFLAANPTDTTRLRLDEESRAIDQAIRQAEFRNTFEVIQHWAVRAADLQGLLLRHKPDIVHFSGHGSAADEIILLDASGKGQCVSARALSQLFAILKDNIRCVVLNACYSEPQARAIAEHIECVVGMSAAIEDRSAISFAASFYQALGYGRSVQTAFDLGCVQLDIESLGRPNIPQLISLQGSPEKIHFAQDGAGTARIFQPVRMAAEQTGEAEIDLSSLREALARHRRNLYRLEEKKAMYGIDVPISILNQIEDETKEIERIETLIKGI